MQLRKVISLYQEKGIPLADIKTVFDGYFHIPFEQAMFSLEEIEDSKVKDTLLLLEKGYPANYLSGSITIQGIHLFLNEDTLIPRNETIAFVFEYIKDNYDFNQKKVLDLCTGSGLIALSIKKIYPESMVYASDISFSALNMAKKSAQEAKMDITFLHSDYLKDIKDSFDVILSNPPYIPLHAKDVQAPFEPALALFGGEDGLDPYRIILKDLYDHLNDKGLALFEMDSRNCYEVTYDKDGLIQQYKDLYEIEAIKDVYQRYRYLKLVKR